MANTRPAIAHDPEPPVSIDPSCSLSLRYLSYLVYPEISFLGFQVVTFKYRLAQK